VRPNGGPFVFCGFHFLIKRIALNAPVFPESKLTMKLNRLFILSAALLEFSVAARAENLASLFTNAAPAAPTAIPRRSSIIFIECHGLGPGDLSCYGQTYFQTPNLDRLAAEGMRFTSYSATSDDLSSAQAALMTGGNSAFAPGETTLAQRLQQAGYHTGLVGEWTLGEKPWTQGFDEFAGFLNDEDGKNYFSDFIWRYAPNSIYDRTNQTVRTWSGREEIYQNTGGQKNRYLPDILMNAMVQFVRVNEPDFANHYRPFFLLVNLPAPRTATTGQADFPVPTDAPFTAENWPQAAKNRAALITRLDDGIGRLFEELNKLKMTNNVAIFFTGATIPEKFKDQKLMNFLNPGGAMPGEKSEAALRVPMIVRWPDHVPAGRVSQQPWSALDFAPTALQIGYVKPTPGIAGISILPALLGQPGTNTPALPDRQLPP
jgi:arylsulfatase A-like enzyme